MWDLKTTKIMETAASWAEHKEEFPVPDNHVQGGVGGCYGGGHGVGEC